MHNDDERARLALLKAEIAQAIDRNAGPIWRSNEQAWQDVSTDFPAGVRAHCCQIVYVEVSDGDGFGDIAGCSLSTPPDLSPANIKFILTAIMAQMSTFELKPLKREGKGNAGVPDADN